MSSSPAGLYFQPNPHNSAIVYLRPRLTEPRFPPRLRDGKIMMKERETISRIVMTNELQTYALLSVASSTIQARTYGLRPERLLSAPRETLASFITPHEADCEFTRLP
ncbi:hypothetical protein GALMADRAFT_142263 [Galerina marginata CBS 339.88]|uniref:Uncharacterized protein n=1 Tax=Galerina marginata (strain CBS 339.88) TaxID=685588 RepID=A0A067SZK1_GALM3|nr:hypothetical protein GALMADRAFT_142263 [Galerina marginata CBS 339.88]